MKSGKMMVGIIVLCLFLAMVTSPAISAPPKSPLAGVWNVHYANGAEGIMTVEANNFNLTIPEVGKITGMIQTSGDYFESILSNRSNGINFIFGYIKGGKLEGKLQENAPCSELKKAFKSNAVSTGTKSCQASFTAAKK